MVPRMAEVPQPIATLPDPPPTLGRHERGQRRDHRRIPTGPIHERPIVRGPMQSHCPTGPLNRKAVHRHEMRDDLPPFSRP